MSDMEIPPPELQTEPAAAEDKRRHGWKRWLLLLLLLVLLLCICSTWSYYLITRRALSKALPGPAQALTKGLKPHYLFSIYGIIEPVGVAVTAEGDRLYVAESGGDRLIHAFDREGKELFNFAPPKSQVPGRAPVYVAVDRAGMVFVTDRIRRSLDLYDAGGNFQSSLTPPTKDGWQPMGIRLEDDVFYFTEVTKGKHRVMIVDKEGGLVAQFGKEGAGTGPTELSFPNSIALDARERLYVSDSNNGRVQVFDKPGNLLFTIPGFSLPRGMSIDGDDRLYVVDAVAHTIKVYDTAKDKVELLFTFGDYGVDDGEFNYPNDIAIDQTGRLYIADRVNNRVQVWVY
ncbi:MAG: hypothetical protein HY868_06465 [Chloroflexi bacterium]|nr:hypothetical protein [Chloroflexota bacterium]